MNKEKHTRAIEISAAVITVSTTRSEENDTSGRTIKNLLKDAGIPVHHYAVVPDKIDAIQAEIRFALQKADCIILNGGTGLTHDDCTIEAAVPLFEKKIDGFGELFRLKSIDEIGTAAMLSRAVAGIISKKAVFCIPGSTAAVTLAVKDLIIPEIFHIISHARI